VYVAGIECPSGSSFTSEIAKLWKNGVEQDFVDENIRSGAYSVFVVK